MSMKRGHGTGKAKVSRVLGFQVSVIIRLRSA
jgi:hypothetical protein